MTLSEYLIKWPDVAVYYTEARTFRPIDASGQLPNCVQVFQSAGAENGPDLYHLTDYYVSAALSGPSYLLVTRESN